MTNTPEYIIGGTKVEVGQVWETNFGHQHIIRAIEPAQVYPIKTHGKHGSFDRNGGIFWDNFKDNTGEHLIKCVGRVAPLEEAKEPQPDTEDWAEWSDMDCKIGYPPVDGDTKVEVLTRNMEFITDKAIFLNWNTLPHEPERIVRYKVIKESSKQPDTDGYVCKCPECGKSFAELGLSDKCTAHKHMYEINAKRADTEGWIVWHGGECPVDGSELAEVKFGDNSQAIGTASEWEWAHDDDILTNIIAYRVYLIVQPAQSEPEQPKKLKLSAGEMAMLYLRFFEFAKEKDETKNHMKVHKEAVSGTLGILSIIENNPELMEHLA